jgi:hypothetical protein
MSAQTWLPLRPMTVGEVLDTAVALLRRRALVLLGASAVLAAGEQIVLLPLRAAAGLQPPYFWPHSNVTGWWLLTALGFGIEATIITLLGGLAAAALLPALTGRPLRNRQLWRTARPVATVVTAVISGGLCGVAAVAGFVPWIFAYGLTGPAAPALVVDRSGNPFSAIGRAAGLASGNGMRACWIRLAAYLSWFAVRLAFGAGWIAILTSLTGAGPQSWYWVVPIAWGLADMVAYATLACVDAVLLVETRIRGEGLDIALGRARSRGEDLAGVLVHRR